MGPCRHLVVIKVVYGGRGVMTSLSFGYGLVAVHGTLSLFGVGLVAMHGVSLCSLSYCGVWWERRGELVVIW